MYKSFPNPSEAKSRGIAIISKILSIHLSRVLLNYFNIGAFKLRTTNNKRANLAASRSFRELSTRKLTGTKTRMERSFSPPSSSIRSRVSKKENASIANLNIVSQIFVPSRRNDFSFSILEFVHRFFAIFITVESNNFPPPLFLSPKPLLARNNVSIRSRSAYLHRIRSKFNRVHLESFRNAALSRTKPFFRWFRSIPLFSPPNFSSESVRSDHGSSTRNRVAKDSPSFRPFPSASSLVESARSENVSRFSARGGFHLFF